MGGQRQERAPLVGPDVAGSLDRQRADGRPLRTPSGVTKQRRGRAASPVSATNSGAPRVEHPGHGRAGARPDPARHRPPAPSCTASPTSASSRVCQAGAESCQGHRSAAPRPRARAGRPPASRSAPRCRRTPMASAALSTPLPSSIAKVTRPSSTSGRSRPERSSAGNHERGVEQHRRQRGQHAGAAVGERGGHDRHVVGVSPERGHGVVGQRERAGDQRRARAPPQGRSRSFPLSAARAAGTPQKKATPAA